MTDLSTVQGLITAIEAAQQALDDLAVMTGTGKRRWTDAERQLVLDFYPTTPAWMIAQVLQRKVHTIRGMAWRHGVKKHPGWTSDPLSNSTRVDPRRGASTRFAAGHQTWNKGKKGWASGGRSAETRYKPGNISGRAAQLVEPVGSYRLDASGILQRKIGTTPGSPHLRWRSVHELVWIEHNGPVPKGHVVVFRPGRRTNVLEQITLDRVECITRAELMRRNSFHSRYPKPVRQIIQLRAALTRKINNRSKDLD